MRTLLAALLLLLAATPALAQMPDSRARPFGPKFNEPGQWQRAQAVKPYALTDGPTITPDASQSTSFTVTLGGNRTLANPSPAPLSGQTLIFYLTQDGTGSRLITWGPGYKFSGGTKPTLSTTSGSVDMISCHALTPTFYSCASVLGLS